MKHLLVFGLLLFLALPVLAISQESRSAVAYEYCVKDKITDEAQPCEAVNGYLTIQFFESTIIVNAIHRQEYHLESIVAQDTTNKSKIFRTWSALDEENIRTHVTLGCWTTDEGDAFSYLKIEYANVILLYKIRIL